MSSSPRNTLALRPRVTAAADSLRPTRAEIDLGAIAHNLGVVRRVVGSASVLAVVKADGYGHGVVPVAARLQAEGVDGFGVALAEEGLELREAGVSAPILVLNGVYGGAHSDVLDAALTPVVYDLGELAEFARAARGRPFGVHLKVDTGMGRLGVVASELEAFLDGFARVPGARIDGLMTHFASADCDPAQTREQLERFATARALVAARGHRPRTVHAANSAAAMAVPEARFDLVRTGIALYGLAPAPKTGEGLRPAMRLRTEVIAIRDLPAGSPIGYGATFHTSRPSRIATVPVGYGDGLLRSTSNRGQMLVRGQRAQIVGNVSMDLTTLDVTDTGDVAVGDEVVLLGAQGPESISAEEIAGWAGTIMYEVLTNVSRRVPRFYS